MSTTIKLDRLTRDRIDLYSASAWLLRQRGVIATNLDGIEEKIDTRKVADDLDKFLLQGIFEDIFPGYTLKLYDIDTGIATVEAKP